MFVFTILNILTPFSTLKLKSKFFTSIVNIFHSVLMIVNYLITIIMLVVIKKWMFDKDGVVFGYACLVLIIGGKLT